MELFSYTEVDLTSGFLHEKQELNRKITIDAVYERFLETGRIAAFACDYREGEANKPHHFWDSDVAKWIEGAAYVLKKHPDPALECRVDEIIGEIEKNQGEDGYFNIFYTVVEPNGRWSDRDMHELYCAGHLMEAAVAYAEATGKTVLLSCMEKYADYIYRVFVEEESAAFVSPGHEEIELALVRLYRYTGRKKYLEIAVHFINVRGSKRETQLKKYSQAHLPVREQTEAVGHAVRALYLYTGMAFAAKETGDEALLRACRTLFEDITCRKMYVTGALGSTYRGEAFTGAFDLPNAEAYAETCAAIALMLFGNAMLALENDARYADAVERALYNCVLSGISLDGKSFFYENPLEIDLQARNHDFFGDPHYAISERVACFKCSCCPPNLNRLLSSLGGYVYGWEGETLFVNQYTASVLKAKGVCCRQRTEYPRTGMVKLKVEGAKKVALRIPAWCERFSLDHPYELHDGYAVVENDGGEILLELDVAPRAVFADPRVSRDVGCLCVMRGPVVYCAEGVDNGKCLHRYTVKLPLSCREVEGEFALPSLEVDATCCENFERGLYANHAPRSTPARLKLIPYHGFANRGESDMLVWLHAK